MKTTDIYTAEEDCAFAHRKLGIKMAKGTATKTDYARAAAAAARLDKALRSTEEKL